MKSENYDPPVNMIKLPELTPDLPKRWLVLGIDPSMSRTGYAFCDVELGINCFRSKATWRSIGSVKGDSATPEWMRAKMYAEHMRTEILRLQRVTSQYNPGMYGLLVCMEFPTPTNTFLVQLNRIIHLVFFQNPDLIACTPIRFLVLNASTMRSVMGLKQRGAKNKGENILRAYDFVDKDDYPGLDSDSCDGVLMGMFGRYAASIMMGCAEEVPANFMNALCSAKEEIKRKGRPTQYTVTKGLMHRPEYWYTYESGTQTIAYKDAHIPTGKKLCPEQYLV